MTIDLTVHQQRIDVPHSERLLVLTFDDDGACQFVPLGWVQNRPRAIDAVCSERVVSMCRSRQSDGPITF
jgi:hypothetical protein